MKKSDELKKTVDELRREVENLQQEENVEAAAERAKELTNAVHQYEAALAMERAALTDFAHTAAPVEKNQVSDAVMRNRVFNKLVLGRTLTEEEHGYVNQIGRDYVNQIGSPGQVEGTPAKGGYLVPEEQMRQIREYRKAYTALKDFAHVQHANSTSGKMPTLGDEMGKLTGGIAMIGIFFIMLIIVAILAMVVVKALANSPWGLFTIAMTIPIAIFLVFSWSMRHLLLSVNV